MKWYLWLLLPFSTCVGLFHALSVLILAGIVLLIGKIFGSDDLKTNGVALALSWDQLLNVCWFGDPDGSISGRCGRAYLPGHEPKLIARIMKPTIDYVALHVFKDPNHCHRSIEREEQHKREIVVWHRIKL